jgi:hypothetical protein
MSTWKPNVTVATVIEREGRYLLVEERDKATGEMVFNQPAGHLEQHESLVDAAYRNGITYLRITFVGTAVQQAEGAVLDPDIHAIHWFSPDEIRANSARMRSPMVLASIEQHLLGVCYPLDLIVIP